MAFLQTAKLEQHLSNLSLIEDLVVNFPMSKKVDRVRHAATSAPFPTVVHCSAPLQEYANVVCTALALQVLHASILRNEFNKHR